jgi:hypothetical protein
MVPTFFAESLVCLEVVLANKVERDVFYCMGMPSLLAFSQDTLVGSVELSVSL